jgi:hypothetical protein
MKTDYARTRTVAIVLTVMLSLGLFGVLAMQALAQDETLVQRTGEMPAPLQADTSQATPEPQAVAQVEPITGRGNPQSESDVEWTASETTFQSNYPFGFQFTVEITSSAGPIARGRIVWSHAPSTQRTRPATIDSENEVLTATWEMVGADAVPPWVGLTYHWEVSDSEGNTFETEPEFAEYEDNTREWTRTESEDIVVFTQNLPEDVGPLVADAMAAQRETYRTAWGDLLPYTPRAILYGDRSAWEEWQITYVNPRVIGLTSDDWGGTAQIVSGGDHYDLAYGTVLHEVAHLYQAAYTIMVPGSWFIEGNATFFEINQQYDYESSVRLLAVNGDLPVLLKGTGPGVSGQNARRGYDVGYTFWKWLTDNYGLEAHRELIDLLDSGTGRNDAIEQVTGLTIDQIESRWRVWLGASAVAPTLIPTPTMRVFPTITPFTFGKDS